MKDRLASDVRPEAHANLNLARFAGLQISRRQSERVPPDRLVYLLAVDFNDLKGIDVDMERMLKNVFIDQCPFNSLADLAGDRRHRRCELLAVDEELHGLLQNLAGEYDLLRRAGKLCNVGGRSHQFGRQLPSRYDRSRIRERRQYRLRQGPGRMSLIVGQRLERVSLLGRCSGQSLNDDLDAVARKEEDGVLLLIYVNSAKAMPSCEICR